jgi:hypothetical protein
VTRQYLLPVVRLIRQPRVVFPVSQFLKQKQTLPENGMSIRIEIGERYVVTSDSFQFILHEKKRAESGKNAGQEWLAVVGYYPKLSQLVSGLMHHDILTGSAKSFADLNAQVEQLSKRCSEAFGSYGR